jgi:hypothetical protein
MANYATKFSFGITLNGPQDGVTASAIYADGYDLDGEKSEYSFEIAIEQFDEVTELHVFSTGEADIIQVITFMISVANAIPLIGFVGFEYSLDCSRPEVDAFGGGVVIISLHDKKLVEHMETSDWLANALEELEGPPMKFQPASGEQP